MSSPPLARTPAEGHPEALPTAAEMFQAAFALAPNGVAVMALDGRFVRVNEALCAMLGHTAPELLNRSSLELSHPDDRAAARAAYERLRAGGEDLVAIELRLLRADGSAVWAACSGSPVRDAAGRPRYLIAHFKDITDRRLAERRRAEADQRFERAFADAPIGMALVGLDGRFLRVNRVVCELTGYGEKRLLALTFQDITHPDDLDADLAKVDQLVAGEIDRYSMEKRYVTAHGEWIWVNLSVSLVRDDSGEPLHFVSQIEDIAERKRLEATLHRLADHDSLTQIFNRRRFEDELARQVGRCRRYGERAALLMVDLDGFKPVNDAYGHRVGDELLVAIAGALVARLRDTDVVARIGGDEFAVLLANVSPDQAALIAEQLRDAVAASRIEADGTRVGVTASVGVVFLDAGTADAAAAIDQADEAMYDAKANRRRWGGQPSSDAHAVRAARRAAMTRAPAAPVRVLHGDDSAAYRRLVREMLAGRDTVEVVADVADGAQALAAARSVEPDVVLLDARMSGVDERLVARLREELPQGRIVVLSGLAPSATALSRLADRFVAKSAPFDELVAALEG